LREYETTFIIQPEITEEGIEAICTRVEGILDKHGATKLFYDDMGRRRLAYEIRKFQKGQYLTLFYLDEGKAVAELERSLRLDDSVLRYLTVLANDNVADIEARKAEAVELERIRAEKAAEKAAREAEEEAARAAEEATRAEQAAAAAASAAASEAASDEPGAGASGVDDEASEDASPAGDDAGDEDDEEEEA
jgi:small subunit ribosomal protein S6